MIMVMLHGGLGNQLFQYAAAKALALSRGVGLLLNTERVDDDPKRHYALGPFMIDDAIVHDRRQYRLVRAERRWKRLFWSLMGKRAFVPLRYEGRVFRPGICRSDDWTCLSGYFQSEKYFRHHAAALRSRLVPRRGLCPAKERLRRHVQSTPSVALHIRRGDYATDEKTKRQHGLLPMAYYQRAIALIKERHPRVHAFVFSDDIAWTREHALLPAGQMVTYVEPGDADRDHEDMVCMSACDHIITANSSFSWWGAWLGENPGKIVVAPRRWFADEAEDAGDLVPDSWIRI